MALTPRKNCDLLWRPTTINRVSHPMYGARGYVPWICIQWSNIFQDLSNVGTLRLLWSQRSQDTSIHTGSWYHFLCFMFPIFEEKPRGVVPQELPPIITSSNIQCWSVASFTIVTSLAQTSTMRYVYIVYAVRFRNKVLFYQRLLKQ